MIDILSLLQQRLQSPQGGGGPVFAGRPTGQEDALEALKAQLAGRDLRGQAQSPDSTPPATPPADDMAWLGRALQGGDALSRPALPEGLPDAVVQSILNKPSYSEQSNIPARINPVDYSDFDQEYSGRNRSYERERLGLELDWKSRFPQMDFPVPEGAWATPTQQSPYPSPLNQMMPAGRRAPLALY